MQYIHSDKLDCLHCLCMWQHVLTVLVVSLVRMTVLKLMQSVTTYSSAIHCLLRCFQRNLIFNLETLLSISDAFPIMFILNRAPNIIKHLQNTSKNQ